MFKKSLTALTLATFMVLAIGQPAAAHPGVTEVGEGVYLVLQHHRDLIVVETNLVTDSGMIAYFGNVRAEGDAPTASGAQIHDACIGTDFDPATVYPSRDHGHFYDYIISQPDTVGADDVADVADATAFWASLGYDIADHDDMHEGCEALGGTNVHADLVVFTDDNLGGEGGHENVDLRDAHDTVPNTSVL